jgi:UDP-glucose 4-epimerase
MKVLLVGGLGFIGRRFIRKFSKIHEIIVYAQHDSISNAKEILDLKYILVEEGNVEDRKIIDVIEKHKPDVVIHLAALTGLMKCQKSPEEAFMINVYGTFNVVSACSKTHSKLIFISSREVYGNTISEESKEEDPLRPNNIYGITKMLGETLIKQESERKDLDFTILRLTNVYGPEGDQYGAQVIIRDALRSGKIQIMGGNQTLNYVYVDDVVDCINLVLTNKKSSRQVFNVGSKHTLSIEQFVEKVIQIVGTKIETQRRSMRETETSNFKPSLKKAKESLGFEAKISLEEGIKKAIQWYEGK